MDYIVGEFEGRFEAAVSKKEYDINDVDAARDYVNSMIGFVRFSHQLYMQVEKASRSEDTD